MNSLILEGEFDRAYHSPFLASNHPSRKPGIGMALQAQKDFPEINFAKSIMVGDSGSDIEFGKNAGMKTIFIGATNKYNADMHCGSLKELASLLG